jgi:hypothetical protein
MVIRSRPVIAGQAAKLTQRNIRNAYNLAVCNPARRHRRSGGAPAVGLSWLTVGSSGRLLCNRC